MRLSCTFMAAALLAMSCVHAHALDWVELHDGNLFNGEVLSLDEKEVRLRHSVLGEVKLPREKVYAIYIDVDKPPKRIGGAKPAPPDVNDGNPLLTPPDKPIAPLPPTVKPAPAADLSTVTKLRRRNWAAFSPGAYCIFEHSGVSIGQITPPTRWRFALTDVRDGEPVVQKFGLDDNDQWEPRGNPVIWLANTVTLDDIGQPANKTTTDTLTIGGELVACTVTEYEVESVEPALTKLSVQVWRSKTLNVPTHAQSLGEYLIAYEPDVARVVAKGEHRGLPVETDWRIESVEKQVAIGERTVKAAVVRGTHTHWLGNIKTIVDFEKQVSDQVPGGIVSYRESNRRGNRLNTMTQTTVEFGDRAD